MGLSGPTPAAVKEKSRDGIHHKTQTDKKEAAMTVIKLEPKSKNPDLKVEYLGQTYVLPGTVTAALMEKLFLAADEAENTFLKVFLSDVVPGDFKAVISQDDLGQLANIWMEHIKGPKDSTSTN